MRFALACAALLAASGVLAQETALRKGEKIELKTDDGWTLVGEYWAPLEGKNSFLLIHSQGGRRQEWENLRRALFAKGFGVLTYDSRGHGESSRGPTSSTATWRRFKGEGQDNDWNRMTLDIDAAARELAARGVETSSVAVGGLEVGANLALKWAATHPQVPMTLLFSPGINHKDVLSVGAMRAYGPRPVLVVSPETDRHLLLAGKVLFDNARFHGGESFAAFWTVPRSGAEMLSSELVAQVLDWIDAPIQAPEVSTEPAHGEEDVPDEDAPAPLLPIDGPQ